MSRILTADDDEVSRRALSQTYRELAEQANSIILRMTPEGQVTSFNKFAEAFFGRTEKEMLGRNVVGTIVPHTESSGRDLARMIRDIAIHPERYVRNENENVRRNGERVWIAWSNKPILDESGKVTEILCVGNDLTERRQAEEALLRSERNYREIFNAANDAIFIHDARTWTVLDVNDTMLRMYEFTREEALRLTPNDSSLGRSPYSATEALQWIAKAVAEGPQMFEWQARKKSGALFWVEVSLKVAEISGQRRVLALVRDITERKRAEEALRWRTAFFEALVDSSLDGILVVDSDGKKILQNRRVVELWKIPPDIAQDRDDAKQVQFVAARTKNPQQFAEKVAYLYAHTNEVSHGEIELIDGMALDRYSSPVRDKNGTYYGRIWTFRDISERRHLEAQLRQAQKMEAVGQLAGGVAHDFNNILTATMMQLGLLRGTVRDSKTRESLKELESHARRAADLTRQLLMFSRKSALEIKPTDLNRVVDEMLKMLRRLLGEQVSVEFRGAPALPMVEADRGMMQQVIMNLSVNARDAMPHGGQLTISTAPAEFTPRSPGTNGDRRLGCFVRLSVADTGCGMDEATRKRIFEPFFTTKELGKGTGLGLATVYGIVQQHRGWIEVKSEPGNGSTFEVFLPTAARAGSSDPVQTTSAAPSGQETILLVEDESMVRRVTARALQILGYRVIEATDGQMATELWSRHADTIQLLLTDMIMPQGLSGMELAQRFQKEKPNLRVIIASGYSAEISGRGVPSRPGILYLAKPFEMLNLATAVRTSLDQHH
jgi:PAS domain S-box-containing protein